MEVLAEVKFDTGANDLEAFWFRCSAKVTEDCCRLVIRYQTAHSECLPIEINEHAPCRDVILRKAEYEKGLGLSIKGGKESQMPIVVSRIFAGMAADRSAQIRVGDAILSVNGTSLTRVTHGEAVQLLRNSGSVIKLTVQQMKNWIVNNERVIDLRGCRLYQLNNLNLRLIPPNEDNEFCCSIRFRDSSQMSSWLKHLKHAINLSTNEQVGALIKSRVHKSGWLNPLSSQGDQRFNDDDNNNHHNQQQLRSKRRERAHREDSPSSRTPPLFVVIDSENITAYRRFPPSMQVWRLRVLSSRLVQSTKTRTSVLIRSGTRDGLIVKQLRPTDSKDISSWCIAFLTAVSDAATAIEYQSFDCKLPNGSSAKLVINVEHGLSLHDIDSNSLEGKLNPHDDDNDDDDDELIWSHPFTDLRRTSDDGVRWLNVQFAPDQIVKLDMASSLKPFVFYLHNFLLAKIIDGHLIDEKRRQSIVSDKFGTETKR